MIVTRKIELYVDPVVPANRYFVKGAEGETIPPDCYQFPVGTYRKIA